MRKVLRIGSLLIVTFCLTVPTHASGEGLCSLPEKADKIFVPRQVRVYETVTPRRGFVGSPYSMFVAYPGRQPSRDEHFEMRFLRISVVGKRKKDDHIRIVFRLDETDAKGAVIREALYFAYLDVFSQGARMLCKYEDDNLDYGHTGIAYGLPFPLVCTRPPALGFLKGAQDGYLDSTGRGVVYSKEEPRKDCSPLRMVATYFNKHRGSGVPVRWYGLEASELAKEDAETRILFRETQKWKRPDDWMWTEMVRHDREGNILMRSRMIELDGGWINVPNNP